jgi:hypothetical protein
VNGVSDTRKLALTYHVPAAAIAALLEPLPPPTR